MMPMCMKNENGVENCVQIPRKVQFQCLNIRCINLGLDRLANFRFSVRFGFQFSVTVRFGLLTENYFRFSDNELRFSVNRQP